MNPYLAWLEHPRNINSVQSPCVCYGPLVSPEMTEMLGIMENMAPPSFKEKR